MAEIEIKSIFQYRRGSTSEWESINPILREGEPGLDTTLRKIKIGDGITPWKDLPFYGSSIENILDGIASGSIRTSSSTTESTNYRLGTAAFAEGSGTKASGNFSHSEGYNTTASGAYSHAEGRSSTASGSVSHAEGTDTVASGIRSHASGWGTIAKGQNQTAIGKYNVEDTSEEYALIVGNGTSTERSNAFTVDWSGNAKAGGEKLATEAYVDNAIPDVSNKMDKTNPTGTGSFSLNRKADTTIGEGSFAEGYETTASGSYSHAKGWNTEASGWSSSAEGANTEASGNSSHAEGEGTTASGYSSHSEGIYTTALGTNSHAEGRSDGRFINYISSENPTKEEIINARNNHTFNIASGDYSHSEGDNSAAIGKASHAEGCTIASGDYSHAEGSTIASGNYSHTEGQYSKASGQRSHAEGYGTTASSNDQHVQGKFNIDDSSNIYADIIGNGTESDKRSNAATVDWSGNAWYAGNVYVGSTSGKNKDEGSKKLATEDYVSTQISAIPTPDVSGQISAHNTSSSAHSDIRQSISKKANASDLTTHTSNTTIHVTEAEKTRWNAKSDFSGSYTDLTNKPTIPTKTSQLTNDSGYLTSAPVTSVNGKTGAVNLTASDVGALPAGTEIPSLDGLATQTYVDNKVAALVDSAPGALDTLNELAAALGDDPEFATTVANQIGNKVDKVDGKGLSTNDYTTAEKNKLSGIEVGANNYTHPSSHPATMITEDSTHRFVTDAEKSAFSTHMVNSTVHITADERSKWNAKSDFSGNYSDLINKPTIPSKTSQLTNDSNFITYGGAPVQSVDGSTGAVVTNAVKYNAAQNLTADQKAQARTNIGAASQNEVDKFGGTVEITNGNPTKVNTVLTLSPDAGEVNLYEAHEIDVMFENISEEIDNYLPKNQGSANVGKILVVGADGNLTLTDMPEGSSGDVIGTLDENGNIIITGNLADGTYVFKYENTNGTYADIGSLVVGGVVQYSITPTLTNCTGASGNAEIINDGGTVTLTFTANDGYTLPESVTVSGASYTWYFETGTLVLSNPTSDVTVVITATKSGVTNIIDTIGYEDNKRLSSSGATKDAEGYVATGMIDVSAYSGTTIVRTKGVNFNYDASCYIVLYDASGTKVGYNTLQSIISNGTAYSGYTIVADGNGNLTITISESASNYFRINGHGKGADLIVTINEEIPN